MAETCPHCNAPRVSGKMFCPGCGKVILDTPLSNGNRAAMPPLANAGSGGGPLPNGTEPDDAAAASAPGRGQPSPASQPAPAGFPEPSAEELAEAEERREGSSIFTYAWVSVSVLLLLGFALVFLTSPFLFFGRRGGHRPQAREKACYANMRVLQGAVAMYNMDNSVMIDRITHSDTQTGGILVKGEYLKRGLNQPTPGCYYSGYDLLGSGSITCSSHGTVE